jgi:hypothetical protein
MAGLGARHQRIQAVVVEALEPLGEQLLICLVEMAGLEQLHQ